MHDDKFEKPSNFGKKNRNLVQTLKSNQKVHGVGANPCE